MLPTFGQKNIAGLESGFQTFFFQRFLKVITALYSNPKFFCLEIAYVCLIFKDEHFKIVCFAQTRGSILFLIF